MTEVYQQLALRCGGPPLALIVDGAIELREGAEPLQKQRETMLILRDFKHFAANTLKKVVGEDGRFKEFSTELGRTRSAIQQTELAHFTPPSPKSKARFMNRAHDSLCFLTQRCRGPQRFAKKEDWGFSS